MNNCINYFIERSFSKIIDSAFKHSTIYSMLSYVNLCLIQLNNFVFSQFYDFDKIKLRTKNLYANC